jgi:TPR repeat protein
MSETVEEEIKQTMKRVEANDARAMCQLGNSYHMGRVGLQQDHAKALELWKKAAGLGSSQAHFQLGVCHSEGGDLKKAKFHYEAAAMAGDEVARNNLGNLEAQSENNERAIKHWMISASAGHHGAMNNLIWAFKQGVVSRDQIDSTLTAYNTSCAEMRSEARDAHIKLCIEN